MKTFGAFVHLTENTKVKWVRPNDDTLKQEYEIEYKKHLIYEVGDVFPTLKSFLDAAKKGTVQEITPSHDSKIMNRSHTRSMTSLLSLIKGYRSYPKFRNENTLNAMRDAMLTGKTMDMPIIVSDGRRERIFAGNTRMDMAFMHGLKVEALTILLPEGVRL